MAAQELAVFYFALGVLAIFAALSVRDFLQILGFAPDIATIQGGVLLAVFLLIAGGSFAFSWGALGA